MPAALAKLDESIEKCSSLAASAFKTELDSEKLFQIIGEATGNYVKRRQHIESDLEDLYDQQNELWDKYVKCIGMTEATLVYVYSVQMINNFFIMINF